MGLYPFNSFPTRGAAQYTQYVWLVKLALDFANWRRGFAAGVTASPLASRFRAGVAASPLASPSAGFARPLGFAGFAFGWVRSPFGLRWVRLRLGSLALWASLGSLALWASLGSPSAGFAGSGLDSEVLRELKSLGNLGP